METIAKDARAAREDLERVIRQILPGCAELHRALRAVERIEQACAEGGLLGSAPTLALGDAEIELRRARRG